MLPDTSYILTAKECKPVDGSKKIPVYSATRHVWVHLVPESENELAEVLAGYKIHPLSIEDIFNPHNRIKIEVFDEYSFFTFRGFFYDAGTIISKNFYFILRGKTLISLALEPRDTIRGIIDNWQHNSALLKQGPEFILHRILDIETDNTQSIVYDIDDISDDFEIQLLNHEIDVDIRRVFEVRSQLQHVKKIARMQKEVMDELAMRFPAFFKGESAAFFRDVKEHTIRVAETAEASIDSITAAIEAHLAMSTRRTNDIMRILTIMTAIVLPMTLLTGVYGMNFDTMPLINSPWGYYITLVTMIMVGVVMMIYFKIKKWL